MKKSILFLFVTILALGTVASCLNDDFTFSEKEIIIDNKSEKRIAKEDFSFALALAINESFELRKLLKEEALKMFNKDYEVLVYSIKDNLLENNMSFEDLINSHLENNKNLQNILEIEPTLTVLVPELPLRSFSAYTWDVYSEIPAIAIRTNLTNEVPIITSKGELEILSSDLIPGFPVLVVKNNERLISNIENQNFDEYDTRVVYNKNGTIIKFWSNSFDSEFLGNESSGESRITSIMDPKIVEAYNIYEQEHPNLNGWQRDYIYYNIQPSNPNGPFRYNFQEHVTYFGMIGDAMVAYNKISDQTGDPTFSTLHPTNTSHWTGGYYEFKLRATINSKNGVGHELINGFSLPPSDLFELEYERVNMGFTSYFRIKSISNKVVTLNLPIINWDIDQYSTSIKLEFEEVDIVTTTTITDTMSAKFANNFQIDTSLPIPEKIKVGLKLGSSLETVQTHVVQRTFTQGNDFLGEAIINFADKVLINKINNHLGPTMWQTREYSTGYCKFGVEPKKVQ